MENRIKNDKYAEPAADKSRGTARLFAKPLHLFIITIVSIFVSEALVMLILSNSQSYSVYAMALLDAALLSLIVFPILYLSILRPMQHSLEQSKRLERNLQKARDDLELRVKERTAELNRRTEQLARLSSQLTLAEERERHRIASLLHDHFQQLLVAARMNLDAAERSPEDQSTINAKVRSLIDESIEASRSLAVELSPPLLYKKGLAAALQWLARSFKEKHGLLVEIQIDPQADPVHEDIRVLLFASVRELLFNVVKHAGTGTASVRMGRDETGRLVIAVGDEGVGFDKRQIFSSSLPGGFGLITIQERLELLGGNLRIESAPGRGSTFTMVVPVQKGKGPIVDAGRLPDRAE